MDFATFKSAYEGLSYAKSALEYVVDKKADAKAQEKVETALARLGDVQDVLYGLRDELAQLQDAAAKLKERIQSYERWDSKAEQYSLVAAPGGAVVYGFKGAPAHYSCPTCFERREVHILQDRRAMSGLFDCPNCKASYPVNAVRAANYSSLARRLP